MPQLQSTECLGVAFCLCFGVLFVFFLFFFFFSFLLLLNVNYADVRTITMTHTNTGRTYMDKLLLHVSNIASQCKGAANATCPQK